MSRLKLALPAAILGAILIIGCTLSASEPPPTAMPQTQTAVAATRESVVMTMTAKAVPTSTPLPSPTVTLEPTATRTPRPTLVSSPTPTATLPTDEEEYNLLYEQAQKEGRSTTCNEEGTLDCRDETMSYTEAILSLLRLPEYADEEPLPSSLNTIYDVTDSETERRVELAISLGLYPSVVWCGSSGHYACPKGEVGRETGPMWLQIVILGPEVPQPCKDSFIDARSPWVEALVCPLDVYQFRMNPYGMWRARDPITKGDWDVLKEQLLVIAAGGES